MTDQPTFAAPRPELSLWRRLRSMLPVAAVVLLAACTTVNVQPPPNIDWAAPWALLPISNHTETPQAGLRAENTIAKGNQLTTGQTFDRNYVNWFPSTFLTYQFSEKYTMGLNMSRRLDRPTYEQLNPFKSFLDPSTLKVGNPYLNPQFTWSFEWNHTFRQRYTATLSYARTIDNITQVIGPVEGLERVTAQTDRNLAEAEYYSLNLSAPLQPFKWWNSINSLDVYQGLYRGNYANTTVNDGNQIGRAHV